MADLPFLVVLSVDGMRLEAQPGPRPVRRATLKKPKAREPGVLPGSPSFTYGFVTGETSQRALRPL